MNKAFLNPNTPIPLEAEFAPRDNDFLTELSDDDIMNIAPHVMVHAMRTASQNGAQVISPRQVPSAYMMGRTYNTANQPFLHVVGSEACRHYSWPVPDGHSPIPSHYREDRPIKKIGEPLARRSPATAQPITRATAEISNPIHKAWIRIKANVDFQNREDVRGDPDGLAVAYARLWGQDDDEFKSDRTVTLAHISSLKSHAISPDTAFARYLGPIQDRRVITVAASASSRTAFGEDFSCDWNAMRVVTEGKFALSCATEGYSMMSMALEQPISNYSYLQRDGRMLVFHPRSGVAWYHGARSFRIYTDGRFQASKAPSLVSTEMRVGIERAGVRDLARLYSAAITWVKTASKTDTGTTNALLSGVDLIGTAVASAKSIGKSNVSELRNAVAEALHEASPEAKRVFTRGMKALREFIDWTYLEERNVAQVIAQKMAYKILQMDGFIGMKMKMAADYRKADVAVWWKKMMDQAPIPLKNLKYGTYSWATMAVYYTLIPPSEKWIGYQKYLDHVGLESMNDSSFPVPSTLPEDDEGVRTLTTLCTDTISSNKREMYSASYQGVYNAAMIISDFYKIDGDEDMYALFRAAAYLWSFRSRCAATVRVKVVSPEFDDPANSQSRTVAFPEPIGEKKVLVTTAPYVHLKALINGLRGNYMWSSVNPDPVVVGRVSDYLKRLPTVVSEPMRERLSFNDVTPESVRGLSTLKYVFDLPALAYDIESFLEYALEDAITAMNKLLADVVESRKPQEKAARPTRDRVVVAEEEMDTFEEEIERQIASSSQNGWSYVEEIDEGYAEEIIGACCNGDLEASTLLDSNYDGLDDFKSSFLAYLRVDPDTPAVAENALM